MANDEEVLPVLAGMVGGRVVTGLIPSMNAAVVGWALVGVVVTILLVVVAMEKSTTYNSWISGTTKVEKFWSRFGDVKSCNLIHLLGQIGFKDNKDYRFINSSDSEGHRAAVC